MNKTIFLILFLFVSCIVKKEKQTTVPMPEVPLVEKSASLWEEHEYKEGVIGKEEKKGEELDDILKQLYLSLFMHHIPSSEGLKWKNVLLQKGSLEGVYRGLILGEHYQSLERNNEASSMKFNKFCESFMLKILSLKVEPSVLRQVSFWTSKRVMTEKMLEVMDALAIKERSSLENWYAHASAMLATYSSECANQKTLRCSTDLEKHKYWAENTPLADIKIEMIIKLQEVSNRQQKFQDKKPQGDQ
jgi:hypothetical protein